MKKLISLLLSAILLISLVACGSASAPAQGGSETTAASQSSGEFLVGYSKVNITCEYSVPLRGYGDTEKRMSNGFTDYIYATCAAITGTNGETVIVFGIERFHRAFHQIPQCSRQGLRCACGKCPHVLQPYALRLRHVYDQDLHRQRLHP